MEEFVIVWVGPKGREVVDCATGRGGVSFRTPTEEEREEWFDDD